MKKFMICLLFLLPLCMQAASYYWVGGSGNWSDINHWATTSGGTVKHIVVPSFNDDVIFDQNSFTGANQIVTMNLVATICRDFIWTGNTQNASIIGSTAELKVFGSFHFSVSMSFDYTNPIVFESVQTGKTIKTVGKTLTNFISFSGNGGEWQLLDDLNCAESIELVRGTLITNGYTITARKFSSTNNGVRTLKLGNSKLYLQSWNVNGSLMDIQPGTSQIFLSSPGIFTHNMGDSLYNLTFVTSTLKGVLYAGTAYYHKVVFSGGGIIQASGNYDSLIFTKNKQYEVYGNHQIIQALVAEGECNERITIDGKGSGGFWKNTDSIRVTYCELEGLSAFGNTIAIARNSFDNGNNTNWQIYHPIGVNLFWVGGTGNWDDPLHWSYSSGGPGGACIPTRWDNVFFDGNSFSANAQKVNLAFKSECRDMNWTTPQRKPIFFVILKMY